MSPYLTLDQRRSQVLGHLGGVDERTDQAHRARALEEALAALVTVVYDAARRDPLEVAHLDARELLAQLTARLANDVRLRLEAGAG